MARVPVRSAALQVGEFAVGVTVAYAAIGAAWAVSHSILPLVLAAVAVVAAAIALELRYGAKATGLVAGLLPTTMLIAGFLVAMSLVAYRLN
ncbi:MAG TPA: hypothetical protein VH274_04105 [Mycobacteriales bacterium]|nr:hypothetical protein [Mycobacteriales bacterium]